MSKYIVPIICILGCMWIFVTFYALIELGLYSFFAIALIICIILAIQKLNFLHKKPKIISCLAILLVCVGVLMFIGVYFSGWTTYTEIRACGLCEGLGMFNGKKCPVCGGSAGHIATGERLNDGLSNWIGVMIANAGFAMLLSRRMFVDKKFF